MRGAPDTTPIAPLAMIQQCQGMIHDSAARRQDAIAQVTIFPGTQRATNPQKLIKATQLLQADTLYDHGQSQG